MTHPTRISAEFEFDERVASAFAIVDPLGRVFRDPECDGILPEYDDEYRAEAAKLIEGLRQKRAPWVDRYSPELLVAELVRRSFAPEVAAFLLPEGSAEMIALEVVLQMRELGLDWA